MSPFQPGKGRKPRIGTQITVTVRDDTLARLDQIIQDARTHYARLPRRYRSRSALIRAILENEQQWADAGLTPTKDMP